MIENHFTFDWWKDIGYTKRLKNVQKWHFVRFRLFFFFVGLSFSLFIGRRYRSFRSRVYSSKTVHCKGNPQHYTAYTGRILYTIQCLLKNGGFYLKISRKLWKNWLGLLRTTGIAIFVQGHAVYLDLLRYCCLSLE